MSDFPLNTVTHEAVHLLMLCMGDLMKARAELFLAAPLPGRELKSREPLLRLEIDRACEHFIERGCWPAGGADQILLIEARIVSAQKIAVRDLKALTAGKRADATDLKRYLHALLIEDWQESGAKKWRP